MGFNGQLIGPPPIHIVETEVDGDISLYDTQEERVIVLNPTASDVWRLADGDMTTDRNRRDAEQGVWFFRDHHTTGRRITAREFDRPGPAPAV